MPHSESAISEIPTGSREPVSTSSFIAAARRAAQAAAAAPPAEKSSRGPFKGGASKAKDPNQEPSTITSKIRSLLVGASVVVIVLGTFKMAMTLLDSGSPPPMPAMESSTDQAPAAQPPAEETVRPAAPTPAMPSMTSPTPIGRQSFNNPAPGAPDGTATVAIPQAAAIPAAVAGTGRRHHQRYSGPAGRAGQPQTRRRCRYRRPNGCPRRSADRCCARPR